MYKAIINLSYAIHPISDGKFLNYTRSGTAKKIIEGETEEDCLNNVNKFLSKSVFIPLEEKNARIRSYKPDGSKSK